MPTDPLSANRLLARLPPHDLARLRPSLQTVHLKLKAVLCESGAPLAYVYSPVRAMLSMIRVMRDGAAIEVATVGNEGMAEISAFQGEPTAATRCVVQLPGPALRMRTEVLQAEAGWHSPVVPENPIRRVAVGFRLSAEPSARVRQGTQAVE